MCLLIEERGLENNLPAYDKKAGVKVVTKGNAYYYDYTEPVNKRLKEEAPVFASCPLQKPHPHHLMLIEN